MKPVTYSACGSSRVMVVRSGAPFHAASHFVLLFPSSINAGPYPLCSLSDHAVVWVRGYSMARSWLTQFSSSGVPLVSAQTSASAMQGQKPAGPLEFVGSVK